ncbi:hypothetical protein TW81_03190 [Vibrio galatheae]|uniref:Phosphate ABC transporter substrate-binding protein n=1 Tax=Vibrio galatheae TaxID=579748 RepID=A0A0F4NN41_9VIBR|nr:hypothetical protein [Vibrio galatheae]KJY84547.1 hypothetical protein TW81_03190 [Vibrio galatheae]
MIRLVITTLLLWIACQVHADEFAIITLNPDLKTMDVNQVKLLYRGRVSHIDGIPVRLLDLPRNSVNRQHFYQKLLNKSPAQMSSIWARISFSGKAIAPVEIEDESPERIFHWLENNKNGIAYVSEKQIPKDVYVIYQLQN